MQISITPEHQAALVRLAAEPSVSAAEIRRLRASFGEAASARLLSAAALQKKARLKFGEGVWWATERSLQQATPWQVARLKAAWFGDATVYDLCCGLGGDALQLARRGPLVAVDADEEIAAMAQANLATKKGDGGSFLGWPDECIAKTTPVPFSRKLPPSPFCSVVCGDVTAIDVDAGAAVHIDPDRRAGGRRSSRPSDYQPSWGEVWRLVERSSGAAVKLAPAARLEDAARAAGHRCWVSLGGSVREQTLLVGSVAERAAVTPGTRSAVICRGDGSHSRYAPASPLDGPAPIASEPRAVLVDPDPAIRAAGLTEAFARDHELEILGSPSGFLTGASSPGSGVPSKSRDASELGVSGRVIWHGASDDRKLRRQLRRLNAYPEVVKTRGTDHHPAKVAKRLRDCGDHPVTLWLGRSGGKVFAAVTR